MAILQVAEADQVELTAPLGAYLTRYPNQHAAAKVTIHHLLTHTSGTGGIFDPEFETHRQQLRTLGDYERGSEDLPEGPAHGMEREDLW